MRVAAFSNSAEVVVGSVAIADSRKVRCSEQEGVHGFLGRGVAILLHPGEARVLTWRCPLDRPLELFVPDRLGLLLAPSVERASQGVAAQLSLGFLLLGEGEV